MGGGELIDCNGAFPDAYGLSGPGAILVRPDGVVGWRSRGGAAASTESMQAIFERLLCRRDGTQLREDTADPTRGVT